uniref:NADH-ubiquinone oxidoreductase chain 4 n=1 Tax=Teliapsocus conterminus TaxID=1407779 RepID=A0A8K2AU18_9NEOP|nr:NADH dehydrogenase subunit 4 [Teliapsocus conterminus]
MLKYMFMLIFMIPYGFIKWCYLQLIILIMSFMFMIEMGIFNYTEGLSMGCGLDLMSYMLILLSIWICMLMLMSSELITSSNFYSSNFKIVLMLLLLLLMLSFYSVNLFTFYLFFEGSLIPTFMIIMGWGYQMERIQASIYLLMYTLISSLPLLMFIFYFYSQMNMLIMFADVNKFIYINEFIFIFMYLAFMVKLPLFMLHLWLPKAHVEAPVAGSMILAGVLLKLGGYGALRLSSLVYSLVYKYMYMIILLSMIGGTLISLNCLRQSDIKLLVAYSSVSHMGIMVAGSMTLGSWGLMSSLSLMLSHGLCSSGLFFLANVIYERLGSRSMFLVKGMLHFMPKISLWWFLFCGMNMAAPPSLNLLSEIGLINSLVGWSIILMIPLMMMSFFAAGYSLYLFSFTQHGKFTNNSYSFYLNSSREYLVLFMHWLPLNFLILNSEIFMNWI